MRTVLALGLALGVAVVAVSAQNPMRPGRWEVTMEMQMPGMQMPEMKTTQCVTAEQLQQDPAAGFASGPGGSGANACKVSDYKLTGNTVSWKMACAGQQAMTGEGEATFTGDAYNGTVKMTMAQGSMSMKMSGKRLGDCTP